MGGLQNFSKFSETIQDLVGPEPFQAVQRLVQRGELVLARVPRLELDELGGGTGTVVAAYDTLRAEGVLESRQGSGTRARPRNGRRSGADPAAAWPPFPVSPVYRTLIDARDDVISLACATFPAHPLVAEVIGEALGPGGDKLLAHHGYLPGGLPALREALADRLTDLGTPTSPDQVLVTTGAQQAVNLAAQMLVRPGDEVVVFEPF